MEATRQQQRNAIRQAAQPELARDESEAATRVHTKNPS